MSELTWVTTASPNAVVSRDELLQWLKVSRKELVVMIDRGFPKPRFTAGRESSRITSRCRWRVGDVRAWIAGRDADVRADRPISVSDETESARKQRMARDELWAKTH